MIRLQLSIDLFYEIVASPADFIFNIHAAQTGQQSLVTEALITDPAQLPVVYSESEHGNRFMRLQAKPGALSVRYAALVDIDHHLESADGIGEVPVSQLPQAVLPYIYPSRYCQSDRLRRLAVSEFGNIPQGYRRVQAVQNWVRQRTSFVSGSSDASTSAVDTLITQVGVCRDFAHLMIALCRALNLPARFVTGIDYGADPATGPTDFHAYVEVYLGDRWYLFEPTGVSPPMGLVRIGTGRDAADVSFATIFGSVISFVPRIHVDVVADAAHGYFTPWYCVEAISTMAMT